MGLWNRFTGIGISEGPGRIPVAALGIIFCDLTVGAGLNVAQAKAAMDLSASEETEFDALVTAAVTLSNDPVLANVPVVGDIVSPATPRRLFAQFLTCLCAGSEPGAQPDGGDIISTADECRLRAADYVDAFGGDGSALRA